MDVALFNLQSKRLTMPAKDKYHEHVKEALIKDGWKITHDPYIIETVGVNYQVDLGAEKVIAAQKGTKKIAVEVKSFLRGSVVSDYHVALGQFLNYKISMEDKEKDRILFLALPEKAYYRLIKLPIIMKSITRFEVKLLILDTHKKTISAWKQ